MRSFFKVFLAFLLLSGGFLPALRPVLAIGPRNVTSGSPVKWSSMPITVHPESDLDVRGKDVSSLITSALSEWSDLADSDVSFTQTSLGVAVDDSNVCDYIFDSSACPSGPKEDGLNPLIIDEDGEITSDFFGSGNRFTTLGFALIANFNTSSGAAIKGEAVFNATCLAGVEVTPGCTTAGLSFTDDDFISFIVHEMGHFLGLDHSQVNLTEATDDDSSNDSLITTMFPTFIVGNGGNFKTPERDDQVGLAQLYPSSSFSSSTWTLSGTICDEDGSTELQCANVIARSVSDSRGDAIAALSGDFSSSGAADGSYEIPGLIVGTVYTIEVESIDGDFRGSSGYTPCRGSGGESAPPAFVAIAASGSYSGSGGETVTVDCTIGEGCGADSDGGGGCSLLP